MSFRPADAFKQGLVSVIGTRLPRAAARFYPDILWRVPSTANRAYLTFDDGPNPDCTERIVDVLDKHDARATFFVLGAKAERQPALVQALHSAGHGLGNHSYTHLDAWKSDTADFLDELDRTSAILEEVTGARIRFMRPPYGHFTRAVRAWCRRCDHKLTMWDVGAGDYLEVMTTDGIEHHVRKHLRPGSIVVLHDNRRCSLKTPEALDRLLARLSRAGWTFPLLPIQR